MGQVTGHKHVKCLLFLFLIGVSLWLCDFRVSVLWNRGNEFFTIFRRMLPLDFQYIGRIIKPLLETVQMSFTGTCLGAVFAFPIAVLCNKRISGHPYLSHSLTMAASFIRAVPVLIIALIASFLFGVGAFSGMVAIAGFTFGILCKMTAEQLSYAKMEAMEAVCAFGNGRLRAFLRTMAIQEAPQFLANVWYALEINIRHAAILGYVGAGGLGILLNEKIAWREYPRVGMILLLLFLLVLFIERLSTIWRKLLLSEGALKKTRTKGMLLIFFLFAGACFFGIDPPTITEGGRKIIQGIIQGLLSPEPAILFTTAKEGIWYLCIQTAAIAWGGTFLGAAFAVPVALFCSRSSIPEPIARGIGVLLAAIRTIPAMIYGLILIRVTGPGPFAGLLTLTVLSFSMLAKLFLTNIEQIDPKLQLTFQTMGCGTLGWIRQGIWPRIKAVFLAECLYRFDVNIRDAAVLGLVGAGGIGTPLLFSMNGYLWNIAGGYFLGLLVLIFFADFCADIARAQMKNP